MREIKGILQNLFQDRIPLLSSVFCLLTSVSRLLTSVFCLLSPVFCLLPNNTSANFEFNPNCQRAMQEILDLRIKDARLLISEEKINNPHNGFAIYLEHYSKCIELIATEDIRVYEDIIDQYEGRMEQMDRLDDGSPFNSWLQAEMLFQTGLAQVKFGTRINGVYKMLSSYERIKDHRKKYPQFWQNQKLTGIYNIILENIPPFLRWAADIFGFTGDAVLGLYQMEDYANKAKSTPGLAEESVLLGNLGFLLARQEKAAFEFMASQDPELLKVTLAKYLYSNAASFVYRNDLTLKMLADIHQKDLQVNFYALPYATGRCKLNHLELDAKDYLHKFLEDYSVQDYKKAACNRLSLCYLLEGNMQKYEEYRAKVLTVGQALRDRDNEAILESSETLIPHIGLLKARLLCDGGYFPQADSVMKTINPDRLDQVVYRLEYYYRAGRILQLTGKNVAAVEELKKSFEEGKDLPYTYATRSALQLGKLHEEAKSYSLALQWYENCLAAYDPLHTTEGIEQDAQKGIKRVKNRI